MVNSNDINTTDNKIKVVELVVLKSVESKVNEQESSVAIGVIIIIMVHSNT